MLPVKRLHSLLISLKFFSVAFEKVPSAGESSNVLMRKGGAAEKHKSEGNLRKTKKGRR